MKYEDADILVYQGIRENPLFCAWMNNERAIWFEKIGFKWVEIDIGKGTILSEYWIGMRDNSQTTMTR
jgi:hypothetical protein